MGVITPSNEQSERPAGTAESRDKPIRILITGGGTGGHVTPALAVIPILQERAAAAKRRPEFLYVGSNHGVEGDLVRALGIPFVGIQTGKLRRASSRLGLLSRKNVADLFRVPVGIVQSFAQVLRFHPHVVLSTGGYVSVPTVIAAGLLGIPIVIHEQTVQVGLANRIAAAFATRVALSFPEAQEELPARFRRKAFVTGNPVRDVVLSGDRRAAAERLGFSEKDAILPTVYVTGGAQGARVINTAIGAALPDLLNICRILHQCGRQPEGTAQDFDTLTERAAVLPERLRRRYILTRFVGEEIGDVYALADLVIGRSGAGTVTELAAVGKPAIFVPLVPTGGDEQTRNAKRSVNAGAAVIIPQADIDGPRLLAEVRSLLGDLTRLRRMREAASGLATPNAAQDLAQAVLELGMKR